MQVKKRRTCRIVDFAVPADYRIKLKERKKSDKYLHFTRDLREYEFDGDTN